MAANIRASIESGGFGIDGRLPSEERLAEEHGVSRGTIRAALALLRANGVVTSRRGTRRVVLGTARTQSFEELLSFTAWARAHGEDPGARTLRVQRRPASAVERERLQLEPDAEIVEVRRLRLLGRTPVMLERTIYPARIGEAIAGLPAESLSHTAVLDAAGPVFADSEHMIDVVAADEIDAEALGCAVGTGLLREMRRTTDPSGVPLLWSEDRFLPGTVSFTVHNSATVTALARRRAHPEV
ncbi:GntR family transcriptional regulator [Microbacterium capsulatum]|uniref:GntR family transcriptional regulator n=1 Tax=Microbacterium capsulatum TaxID=3041921 RepID=A0ABU0XH41_9MICO|nr:GntR family transcriptional regulator [Microbacterium sp. ASV81]MDQ4214457.1 GntR family transcriptional regulator [Microbacterium sp. ASV81]